MAPSLAPTTSAAGTTYDVVTRRLNLDGQPSSFSPVQESNLPATITPQFYLLTADYSADQVLVSSNSGITWRIVPGQTKGAQVVPAFDTSWVEATNIDTQDSVTTGINFGSFGALTSPTKSFFIVNTGNPVQSLTYSFINQVTNQVASEYSGLIQIAIDGVFSASGNLPSTIYNNLLLWSNASGSLNTQRLLLASGQFVKLTVSFVNFPIGGINSQELNLSFQAVANQTTIALGLANSWPDNTLEIDYQSWTPDILVGNSAGSIIVKPFLARVSGVLVVNYFNRTISLGGNSVERWIFVNSLGVIKAATSLADANAGGLVLGRVESQESSTLAGLDYLYSVKPQVWLKQPGSLAVGLFAAIATGDLEVAVTVLAAAGVTFGNGLLAVSGLAWVVAGEELSKGDLIAPGTGGKAFVASGTKSGVCLLGAAIDKPALITLT